MTTERGIETEAYKGTGGMWYSYPSGRILGPDLPERFTEITSPKQFENGDVVGIHIFFSNMCSYYYSYMDTLGYYNSSIRYGGQ